MNANELTNMSTSINIGAAMMSDEDHSEESRSLHVPSALVC